MMRNRLIVEVPFEPPKHSWGGDAYDRELNNIFRALHEVWFLQTQRQWLGTNFGFFRDCPWTGYRLQLQLSGGDIHHFAAEVKRVAALIGRAPDKTSQSSMAGKTAYFWLSASWDMEKHGRKFEVRVQLTSSECKVDPRSENREAVNPELHPECKSVLESLTDINPATLETT